MCWSFVRFVDYSLYGRNRWRERLISIVNFYDAIKRDYLPVLLSRNYYTSNLCVVMFQSLSRQHTSGRRQIPTLRKTKVNFIAIMKVFFFLIQEKWTEACIISNIGTHSNEIIWCELLVDDNVGINNRKENVVLPAE